MATTSPADQYGARSGESASADVSGQSDNGKSPLSMSLGFLKTLTEKKVTRADGQPPKRRGPKPDSKPALTRRQELNRQAQRTHRERKELYIKALEEEVLRLKETFSTISREKDVIAEENRQIILLLTQHGIAWPGPGRIGELGPNAGASYTSSGSISGSYTPDSSSYSPPPQNSSRSYSTTPADDGRAPNRSVAQQQTQHGIDYDQAGIDFVLTLERPCMDHMQFLVERSSEPDGDPCGHALMASCPPKPFPENDPDLPFGHTPIHSHGDNTQKTWDLSKDGLANLLDLSKRLDLEGQITPVMAWGMVLAHPRFSEMTASDFKHICVELGRKIRCFGFGAVLEEFEVRDTLESVFCAEPDMQAHMDIKMELQAY